MVFEIQQSLEAFAQKGYVRLPWQDDVARWAGAARSAALRAVGAPENAHWLQCQGTWFVGVDVLPNDPSGRVGDRAFPASLRADLAALGLADLPLHAGQVSVTYPGYPKPREGESEAAFRFRRDRGAAHLDGLLPVGDTRRRMLREPHAYILGLPLSAADPGASPLVVWEGSHLLLQRALAGALAAHPPERWGEVDLTEVYTATRREIFETCHRVELAAAPGEATLLHRLALHGVAPWGAGAWAAPEGRMIAYFRPQFGPGALSEWIAL